MDYKLYYGKIDHDGEVPLLRFKTNNKRKMFILDKVIDSRGTKVFVLFIDYGDAYKSIYVFNKWFCVRFLESKSFDSAYYTFSLYEYESYQEAYKSCLDLQEENPLCYGK